MSQPNIYLKNQFGEVSENALLGGSGFIDCNFIVDAANGNGLGIRSLKYNGDVIANVYMHTSSTPAVGNPNPAVGYIALQFKKGYSGYVGGYAGFAPPLSGSSINVTTGVTQGLAYVITSVGTTTQASFQALGLQAGVVPAVGASFIAKATTTATGTGTIQVPLAAGSGISHVEVIGDPNISSAPTDGSGGWILLALMGATSTSVTTFQKTAPADGTVIGLRLVMNQTLGEVA